jgi:hypothetical protein
MIRYSRSPYPEMGRNRCRARSRENSHRPVNPKFLCIIPGPKDNNATQEEDIVHALNVLRNVDSGDVEGTPPSQDARNRDLVDTLTDSRMQTIANDNREKTRAAVVTFVDGKK